MTITTADGFPLVGTLTLPVGDGPHPAVLLLHGSGPVDRNGDAGRLAVALGPQLSSALAAAGIATLRYDRRGVGESPGKWRTAGFTDNREDAREAVRALADHPSIRESAIAVVGHSEGALHAMALASEPGVRAAVLLAGYARPGDAALIWQARSILQSMPAAVGLFRRPLAALGNRLLSHIRRSQADVIRVAGLPCNARWMRENLARDTRDDLAAATAPLLAITGDKDLQVDPADLEVIRQCAPGHVETHRIRDLTHILRRDPRRPTLSHYRRLLREPIDAEVLHLVTNWLTGRLAQPGCARSTHN